RARDLLRRCGERDGEAHTWDSLGYIHRQLGQHAEAVECYRQSLRLAVEFADRPQEAEILANLAEAHLAAYDTGEARRAWQRALAILDELDHPGATLVRAKLAALAI